MAGATLTTYDAALRIDHMERIRDQLENSAPLLAICERNTEDTDGKHSHITLHTSRNEGISYVAEDGTLNDAGYQGHAAATFPMKYMYQQIRLTGPSMAMTQTRKGAAAKILQVEVDGALRDLKKDVSRMFYGDGSGLRATVTTTDTVAFTSTNLTVNAAPTALRHLGVNMQIDLRNKSTGARDGFTQAMTIAVLTPHATAPKVGFSSSLADTISSGDAVGIYRKNSRNNVPYGLAAVITTGNPSVANFGGINRSTAGNEYWKANAFTNSTNRAISQELLDSAFDEVDIKCNELPDIGLCKHAIARRIAGLLIGTTGSASDLRRKTTLGPIAKLDGGWRGVEWNGVPIYVDNDMYNNTLYLWKRSHIFLVQPQGNAGLWNWIDEDGSVLARVTNKDAFVATLRKYCNMASDEPQACIGIYQISES